MPVSPREPATAFEVASSVLREQRNGRKSPRARDRTEDRETSEKAHKVRSSPGEDKPWSHGRSVYRDRWKSAKGAIDGGMQPGTRTRAIFPAIFYSWRPFWYRYRTSLSFAVFQPTLRTRTLPCVSARIHYAKRSQTASVLVPGYKPPQRSRATVKGSRTMPFSNRRYTIIKRLAL